MNAQRKRTALLLTGLVALEAACIQFPNTKIEPLDLSDLKAEFRVYTPAKVYLRDGTIVLFQDGFKVEGDQIVGPGFAYPLILKDSKEDRQKGELLLEKIPLTQVAAANVFTPATESMSLGSDLGSFMLELSGAVLVPLSVYCLTCPKCCFGSCPTVYDESSGQPVFEAELFSYSISKLLEAADIDILNAPFPIDRNLRLRVTNEAMETHFINAFALEIVEHPAGTSVCASPALDVLPIGPTVPPDSAITIRGENILDKLREADGSFVRSGDGPVKALLTRTAFDGLEVVKYVGPTTRNARMTIRYRNTLLTTILFYDIVLASQGLQALDWTARMNSNPVYASQFLAVYKYFSGIQIKEWTDGRWQSLVHLPDAGPLNWKTLAVDVPVLSAGEIRLRLEYFPDNFMIDAIGFDLNPPAAETVSRYSLSPLSIRDFTSRPRPEFAPLLDKDDGNCLITEPGDSFILEYQLPIRPADGPRARSLAVSSKGYYLEWIRGSWVQNDPTAAPFRLNPVGPTICRLAESWLRDRKLLEQEFFRARIPLKKP
jgi:hypothetical protein